MPESGAFQESSSAMWGISRTCILGRWRREKFEIGCPRARVFWVQAPSGTHGYYNTKLALPLFCVLLLYFNRASIFLCSSISIYFAEPFVTREATGEELSS